MPKTGIDYRKKQFLVKFNTAAKQLNVKPEQIISLKIRETVSSYGDYDLLLETLRTEGRLGPTPINDGLQGKGFMLDDGKNRVIIVEHETGLELLYIAGSIASLVTLVPLVVQCWSWIRDRYGRNRHHDFQCIETRYFDNKGELIEDSTKNMFASMSPIGIFNTSLTKTAEIIDKELQSLREQIHHLSCRMDILESKRKVNSRSKKSTKRIRKKK